MTTSFKSDLLSDKVWIDCGKSEKYECFIPANADILSRGFTWKIKPNLIRPWDYPENLEIYSQLDGKSKIWFLTFLNVYVSWIERDRFWSHSFHLQNLRILQTRMDQSGGGGPWCQQKILGCYSNLGICNWKFSSIKHAIF